MRISRRIFILSFTSTNEEGSQHTVLLTTYQSHLHKLRLFLKLFTLKYSYRLASLPGSMLRPIIIIMVYSAASGSPHDAASICLVNHPVASGGLCPPASEITSIFRPPQIILDLHLHTHIHTSVVHLKFHDCILVTK